MGILHPYTCVAHVNNCEHRMNIVILALLGIVLLFGLIAFGVGHKGWGWGTITFSVLTLLAAAGFVFLGSRIAERERIWREKVRALSADIARTRDGMQTDSNGILQPIPGEDSLAVLQEKEQRWLQALNRVNTWRGRMWQGEAFQPPKATQPGELTLPLPNSDDENTNVNPNPFINAGSQVYVFDSNSAVSGGRYLGVFNVDSSAIQDNKLVLSVKPLATPTEVDKKLWNDVYQSVHVFEGLPVDRWLAFYHTQMSNDDSQGDDDLLTQYPGLPSLRKANDSDDPTDSDNPAAKDLLADLEEQLDEFEKHGIEVQEPDEGWQKLVEESLLTPGEYWASVTFSLAYLLEIDTAETFIEPGVDAKSTDDIKIRTTARATQFEKGDRANLLLENAIELQENDIASIDSVFYRRPLLDLGIAMEGNAVAAKPETDDQAIKVNIPGGYTIHGRLTQRIEQLNQSIKDLAIAKDDASNTLIVVTKEREQIDEDLPFWEKDVTESNAVRKNLEQRLNQATQHLDDAWKAVVQAGREYDGAMSLLRANIEKQAK